VLCCKETILIFSFSEKGDAMNSLIRTCLCMALCFSFSVSASELYGQAVYSISGVVEELSDTPLAGEVYVAEFQIDTTVVDIDPSPDRGEYPNAILSASVVFGNGFISEIDFSGGTVIVQRDLAGGGVFLQDATGNSTFLVFDLNNPFDTDALPTDPALQFTASPDSLVSLEEPTLGLVVSFSEVEIDGGTGPIVFAVTSGPVVLRGDCDLDGEVTFFDIPPFIDVLLSGSFLDQADCNSDGIVNFGDIPVFVGILLDRQ